MRILSLLSALPLAAALVLALAWTDVLPGAWMLRGLIEDHQSAARRRLATRVAERVAGWREENAAAPAGAVVFVGSSTMERFPLDRAFPDAVTLNRGIGDEPAWSLARRLAASLPERAPAGVVAYVGSVDLRREGSAVDVVVERARGVVDRLAELTGGAPLTLIGVLPERDPAPEDVARWRELNARLAQLAAERGAGFVDTDRPPLRTDGGGLATDCSVDRLHLNAEGYRHLARWLVEDGGEVGSLLAP